MAVRLELVVLSYNGQALAAPLCRALDTPVSVGRGSDNDLALNDPERLISRHQARLSMGPGGSVDITNLSSSSSLFINGTELAPGRICTMGPTDQLLMGRYVLGLRPAGDAAPIPAPMSTAAPAAQIIPPPSPMPLPAAAPPQIIGPSASHVSQSSYAPPAQAAPAPPPRPAPVPVPPASPMATRPKPVQMIPDDFDVFSPPSAPPLPFSTPLVDDVVIEDANEKAAVREVFAELQTLGNDVIAEPLEEARQRSRVLDLNRNGQIDPLQLFDSGMETAAPSASLDHGLEIDSLFVVPSLIPEAGFAPQPPAAPLPPAGAGMPIPPPGGMPLAPVAMPSAPAYPAAPPAAGSVAAAELMMAELLSGPALDPATSITSFDNLLLDAAPPGAAPAQIPHAPPVPQAPPVQTAPPYSQAGAPATAARAVPPSPAPAPAPPRPAAAPPAAAMPPAAAIPPAAATAPATAPAATPANFDTDAAAILRAAFARGCGIDVNHVADFTPQALEVLGRLFAAMTNGTIRLMHGRSSTKHEMRANVTIIATDGNNPLKFAPDSASALMQLLGRGSPAFMPPLRAIDDAFDDLSAHQVGLLAGSRAAMYDVAALLGPDRFLALAGERSGLEAMMPAKHKARLWDLYATGYQEMVGAAREEFENLFQRAFARAYEQEIDRINSGKSR